MRLFDSHRRRFSVALVFLFLLILTPLFTIPALTPVYGDDDDNPLEEIGDLQEKIREYEDKIAGLRAQETTLANEINYLENQVYLTELRIEEARANITEKEAELVVLRDDIDDLIVRIDQLEGAIEDKETAIISRIRRRYKARISPLEIFLGGQSFTEFVNRTKYLKVLELTERKLLGQIKVAKENYQGRKALLEEKKRQVEYIRQVIVSEKQKEEQYRGSLMDSRATKEWLLGETQNEEDKYQTLLAQVKAELQSIASALSQILSGTIGEGKEVKRGDIIGFEGNTGCSTGPHLHFGVYKNGVAVDPLPYLKSGDLKWPIDKDEVVVTQYFGENRDWYQKYFGINGHNGLDITGLSPFYGTPIYAAEDGQAYVTYDSQACWLTGTVGKGIVIDHGDDLVTVYWHVQ